MSEARFPPLAESAMTDEQRRVATAIVEGRQTLRGPFHMLLRNPALGDRVQNVGRYLRFENTLPDAVKELVILVTARYWGAQFEWAIHRGFALDTGLPAAVCDAIGRGQEPAGLTPEQQTAYDFASELLATKGVNDPVFARARQVFGEAGVVELTICVGYYGLIGLVLNTDRTPPPPGAEALPPLAR
ncbi:MAG: carboxymuconolactone decarboxylase family protein [Alphaproteobacteria bacterium]|nr:carboxymuconolactone decarboxylase family protein [Alphaproteobacteria bacterium]